MSAVIKENGLHEALYMEFLPRIMQCVVFCLCESYGGFSMKFTKYYSLVHVYVIHKHTRPRRINFMAWLGCLWTNFLMCSCSWTGQGGFFYVVDDDARTNYTWRSSSSIAPFSLCCLSIRFFFFFWIPCLIVDTWHNPRYFNHVVFSFKKNATWLLLVGHIIFHAKLCCL